MSEWHDRARPHVEALLEPGEQLAGLCVATQSSAFRGRMVALATTDRRLLVLPLDRKIEPSGEPIAIAPGEIAKASAEGAGGGWANIVAAVMDGSAVTLKLRTTGGEKLKLMMMSGAGPLAKFGGGEEQRAGVEALGRWFEAAGD
ncbi:MAG TPA: hypothetical protein VFY99_01650 [Solirubrobacterales bacterium]